MVAHDPLSDVLDKRFGAGVTDFKIFSNLTQYWENEFHEDMKSLNVSSSGIKKSFLLEIKDKEEDILSWVASFIFNVNFLSNEMLEICCIPYKFIL